MSCVTVLFSLAHGAIPALTNVIGKRMKHSQPIFPIKEDFRIAVVMFWLEIQLVYHLRKRKKAYLTSNIFYVTV